VHRPLRREAGDSGGGGGLAGGGAVTLGIHRDKHHAYSKDGEPWEPGITTAIGMLDKGWAISNWNRVTTARAAMRNARTWAPHMKHEDRDPTCPVCMAGWKKDATPEDRAARWLSAFPGIESEKKMNLGSLVHDVAEKHIREGRTDLSGVPDDAMPFVEAWVRDFVEGGETPGHARPVFHPAYLEFVVYRPQDEFCMAYGGTMDVACRIGDDWYLIDYKTGSGVYGEVRMQLAAGANGAVAGQLCPGCLDDKVKHVATRTFAVPKVTKYAVVHVRPEGARFVPFDIKPADVQAFAATRMLWHWDKNYKEVKAA
jgi:hypothetical protein